MKGVFKAIVVRHRRGKDLIWIAAFEQTVGANGFVVSEKAVHESTLPPDTRARTLSKFKRTLRALLEIREEQC